MPNTRSLEAKEMLVRYSRVEKPRSDKKGVFISAEGVFLTQGHGEG